LRARLTKKEHMEFRLTYRGPLKANGSVQHKHELRRHFHKQLAVLWKQMPLSEYHQVMLSGQSEIGSIRPLQGFVFAPLVQPRMHLIAGIGIVLLRPEEPGSIVTKAGDIDNRLKTLLDSLRMPQNRSEIPSDYSAHAEETPFFCLLEDDNLISNLSVTSDRLLEPAASASDVLAIIHVDVKVTRATMENLGLGM
jgi:hypothetical protein